MSSVRNSHREAFLQFLIPNRHMNRLVNCFIRFFTREAQIEFFSFNVQVRKQPWQRNGTSSYENIIKTKFSSGRIEISTFCDVKQFKLKLKFQTTCFKYLMYSLLWNLRFESYCKYSCEDQIHLKATLWCEHRIEIPTTRI